MGTRYEIGHAKAGVNTANTVMWALRSPTRRSWLHELGIFVDTAPTTAPQFVLARNTAGTVTSSTTVVGLACVPEASTATATLDSAWSTPPTFTTTGPFIRRATLPVTAGAGIIWTWGDGLIINSTITTSLVIANAAASGATLGQFSIYASWEEG
jgi:hypothetical protein